MLNEDTHPAIREIGVSHTACTDEFRRNLRSQLEGIFIFYISRAAVAAGRQSRAEQSRAGPFPVRSCSVLPVTVVWHCAKGRVLLEGMYLVRVCCCC